MLHRESLTSRSAPKAIGPYVPGVLLSGYERTVYLSGQIGIDPSSNKMELCSDTIEGQFHRAMENIKALLQEANFSLENIVKVTIYLSNMEDFPVLNKAYASYFPKNFPARSTVEVSRLPLNALIEMDCIAVA